MPVSCSCTACYALAFIPALLPAIMKREIIAEFSGCSKMMLCAQKIPKNNDFLNTAVDSEYKVTQIAIFNCGNARHESAPGGLGTEKIRGQKHDGDTGARDVGDDAPPGAAVCARSGREW